jgi:hypothetical protein
MTGLRCMLTAHASDAARMALASSDKGMWHQQQHCLYWHGLVLTLLLLRHRGEAAEGKEPLQRSTECGGAKLLAALFMNTVR